jgi:hypothetical protein
MEKGTMVKFAHDDEADALGVIIPGYISPGGVYVILAVEPNGTIHLGPRNMSQQDMHDFDPRKNYRGDERYDGKVFGIEDPSMLRLLTN